MLRRSSSRTAYRTFISGLATGLATGLCLLAGALTLSAPAAHAQARIEPIVVLDFAVGEGVDPVLGRKAADALAVELQRSGDFEVITRQQVEQAVSTQPGLRPPYNESTQMRLAGAVGARYVFSGRVVRAIVNNRKAARAQIEVRQLDAPTGDYINGTQVSEITSDKLQEVDNDVLLDEAINKTAFSAVRAMKQTRLPEGTVLNVTAQDIEINLGARNGVAVGQQYSVLRDVFNKSKDAVERVKVGEVRIVNVEADQSTARLSGGGLTGVKTGDKLRQVFIPSAIFPVSSGSGSGTPVTAPPAQQNRNTPKIVKKGGALLIGAAALVGLVALAGFGGSDPGSGPATGVRALPSANSGSGAAVVNVDYRSGLPRIQRSEIIGYFIFRGTSPSVAASADNLIDFVRGNQTTYSDNTTVLERRQVVITEVNPTGTGAGSTTAGTIVVNETESTLTGGDQINETAGTITAQFTHDPLIIGIQYFYRVIRITSVRTEVDVTGTGNNTGATTRVDLNAVLSDVSQPSGGATAILQPDILSTSGDLNDFTVSIVARNGGDVTAGVDRFVVEVSTSTAFPRESTFTLNVARPAGSTSPLVLDLNAIRVPGLDPSGPLEIFVRVGSTNTTDDPGAIVFSRVFRQIGVVGASVASRFLGQSSAGRRRGGVGLPGNAGGGGLLSGPRRTPGRILRPR